MKTFDRTRCVPTLGDLTGSDRIRRDATGQGATQHDTIFRKKAMDPKSFLQPTSRYRELAYKKLKAGNPGDTITINQLRDVMDAATLDRDILVNIIWRVRRQLQRENSAWWDLNDGVYLCLTPQQAVPAMQRERQSLSRKAKRTLERASCVDAAKLNSEERRQFDLSVSQAAMARMVTSRQMEKRLIDSPSVEPPKLSDIASLFGKAAK